MMAVGDLVTADWMMEYQGLAVGDGTDYALVQVEGLLNLPDVRTSDLLVAQYHGAHPGVDYLGGRAVTITVESYTASASAQATSWTAFSDAFDLTDEEQALVLQIPGVAGGSKVRLYCRPRRRATPVDLDWYYRIPRTQVEVFATDPLLYSNTEHSQVITLPTAGGGLTFPLSPPFTFGAVATGGSANLTNAGSFQTWPTFRIDGPCTDPRIVNATTDESLDLTITVASGDFLLVDMRDRTVLLNGTASRYSSVDVGSDWWSLDPGVTEVQYRAATTTTSTLTVYWRDAWV